MRRRRFFVLILAFVAFLAGLATGRDILFNVSYMLALLLILSFLWAWVNINWLYVSRVTRTRRTQVGRPLEERFSIRNTSRIPKLWLQVQDFSTVPGHYASHVINGLAPRGTYNWRVYTTCRLRGRFQLGPVRITTSDPFGLFEMERYLEATSNVVVYPATVPVTQFILPAGLLPGGDALRRRTHYVTTNASGVRDYSPGDSFNRIHWRSTARRNRLVVKEFELDPLADIWVVPDMSSLFQYGSFTPGSDPFEQDTRAEKRERYERIRRSRKLEDETIELPQSTEEYIVTIAASIAQYFLRIDRSVGMLAYGQSHEVVQPDRGERQLSRILETLAVMRAEGIVPLQDLLHAEQGLLPKGTTVISISATTDPLWANATRELGRRGSRVVAIQLEPESFGGEGSGASMLPLLQMNRVPTYLIKYGDDLGPVLSQKVTLY
ncbi:MAG: DUF58 domain-containing protein [Anaerolineales bacterium]|nr:DUF58 domain-containing protein [Anaerolineales bacterium]